MSFSISPDILSPATSPAISMPLLSPPEQTIVPFPSPLPPDTTPASEPPAIPPEASPATSNSSPPLPDPKIPPPSVSLPPPTPSLPVPSPPLPEAASIPPPETATPYSPPAPESSSPPGESFSPLPESSPPPPESSSTPLPESSPPLPVPQVPVNTNSPPPIITPPLLPPANPTVPSPDAPLPAESIPLSPPLNPNTPGAPALPSPPSALWYPPPFPASAGNGGLPAAVQIEKPQPSLKVLPGFIGVCVVVVAVLVACVVCCKRRRRRTKGKGLPLHHKAPHLAPKDSFSTLATLQPPPIKTRAATNPDHAPSLAAQGTFSYGQLSVATDGFSESNLLGEGGFGCVYKGVMAGGKEVAVKRLRASGGQGEREFRAEVDTISWIHHKHLVSLVGYCITGAERLLVYEFLPNDSLEFHLHGKQNHVMEWETRLKIAIGSAKGLAYLHEDCNPKIIHRDIKASNILLDFRFEAKVSDFGLARSFSDSNTHISTRVVGTFGYLAPEYASSGKVTEKSDVYSYGVVLLELITGKPPISNGNQGLVEWARPLLVRATEDGDFDALADPRLQRSYNAAEMSRMVACAAACVRHSAWLRPRMSQIVHSLEGHAAAADLHEGVTPGSSGFYGSPGSRNDLNRLYAAVTGRDYGNGSTRSGSTSEYGLDPSVSSGEALTR